MNRADVGGYVVAALSVAAGGGAGKLSFFISQADGQSVDFGLDGVIVIVGLQSLFDPLIKFGQFVRVVGVVDAEHWYGVGDGFESIDRLFGDPLGGGVGRNQIRVFGLELF